MLERLANKRQLFRFMEKCDAIQELQIKTWRAIKLYDPKRGRLYSFLCNVLNNRISSAQLKTATEASRAKFISIDDREDGDGNHQCWGMQTLNRIAIERWKNGESASSAPATDGEQELPVAEKEAIAWLIQTISSESAPEASNHIVKTLQDNFGLPAERGRALFFKVLVNLRRKKILKRARMATRIEKILAAV